MNRQNSYNNGAKRKDRLPKGEIDKMQDRLAFLYSLDVRDERLAPLIEDKIRELTGRVKGNYNGKIPYWFSSTMAVYPKTVIESVTESQELYERVQTILGQDFSLDKALVR